MSYYQQIKAFVPSRMGTQKGWCLKNVRLGFGIANGKFPSAKADMESQKKNKTLHDISTLPSEVAVPVYCDTVSQYEHVIVCDRGTWWEDGKKIKRPNYKFFGWGELCDGTRVVQLQSKKTNEQIADEVIRGLWGNGTTRKQRLTNAGYNYDTIQKLVNQKLQGSYTPSKKTNEQIAREVIQGKWGNGSARKKNLEKAGYGYNKIQSIVNQMLR